MNIPDLRETLFHDVIIETADYTLLADFDRSAADPSLPLDSQPVWRIVKITSAPAPDGSTRHDRLYPDGLAAFSFPLDQYQNLDFRPRI